MPQFPDPSNSNAKSPDRGSTREQSQRQVTDRAAYNTIRPRRYTRPYRETGDMANALLNRLEDITADRDNLRRLLDEAEGGESRHHETAVILSEECCTLRNEKSALSICLEAIQDREKQHLFNIEAAVAKIQKMQKEIIRLRANQKAKRKR